MNNRLCLFFIFLSSSACATGFKSAETGNTEFKVKTETCGSPEAKAKVVIFPPSGGATTLERWYASKICDRGGFAILVNDWTGAQESAFDEELHDRHLQRSFKVYQELEKKWKGPFRVLGTSLGGLYAAAISIHYRWDKMVLVTTGGPLSEVLSTSDLRSLITLREKRKAKWNIISDKRYEQMLGRAIDWDFMAPRYPEGSMTKRPKSLVPANQIMMSIALGDDTVPYSTQENLWEALGRPKRFDLSANHFYGIVRTYWHYSDEIADFLAGSD
jgi:hypothetical protein